MTNEYQFYNKPSKSTCLLSDLGFEPKKVFHIPVKDKNGFIKDKVLRVVEGSNIHKQLLKFGSEMPKCWIVE